MAKSSAHTRRRLDDRLVALGLAADREEALRAIVAGEVLVNEVRATSTAQPVDERDAVRRKGASRYVSRGGDKLAGALEAFHCSVEGLRCIDVGASTGGFTDCLLQHGAAAVTAVDVGYGQLAWKLRSDPRVTVFERTNIRLADPASLGAPFDLIVADVSFIGLQALAPVIAALGAPADAAAGRPGSLFIGLIKPQFESHRGETEGGVVRDPAVWARVQEEVTDALAAVGFTVRDIVESPLLGPAGNHEFFCYANL